MDFFPMKTMSVVHNIIKLNKRFLLVFMILFFQTTLGWAAEETNPIDELINEAIENQNERNSDEDKTVSIETGTGRVIGGDFFIDKRLIDYQLMTYIFGTMGEPLICTHENCNTLVGELFRVLNIGISTIGIVLLAYIIVMSAFNSGGGDMLSQQFSSNAIAFRGVIGISFLMPNKFGYSILQQIVMSIALLGSSFANVLWHNFQNYYDLTGGFFSSQVVQSNNGEVTFETAQEAANVVVSTLARMAAAESYMNSVSASNNTKQTVMRVKSGDAYGTDDYLSSTVPASSLDLVYNGKETYRNKLIFKGPDQEQNRSLSLTQYGNIKALLSSYFTDGTYEPAGSPSTDVWINDIIGDTLVVIRDRLTLEFIKRPSLQQTDFELEIIKNEFHSWISLPDDFFQMLLGKPSIENPEDRPATKAFSIQTDYQVSSFVSHMSNRDLLELDAIDKKMVKELKPYTPVKSVFRYDFIFDDDLVGSAWLTETFKRDFEKVFNDLQDQKKQPLIVFLEYGLERLEGLFDMLLALFFLQIIPILILGVMSWYQNAGTWYLTFNALFGFLISLLMLFLIDLPIIVTMVFLIPLIPAIIYFSAVLAWFIQVVSSVIASPIVALGFISPGQGLGRASPALVLMINLFFRPSLIIIGFVAGLLFFNTFIVIFSQAFLVLSDALDNLRGEVLSFTFLPAIGFIVLQYAFTGSVTALISKCFNLVFLLPDQILSWIGGQALPFGRDAAQTLGQVQPGISRSAGEVTQNVNTISQGLKTATNSVSEQQERRNKKKKREEEGGN